jgi:hypothetical protein
MLLACREPWRHSQPWADPQDPGRAGALERQAARIRERGHAAVDPDGRRAALAAPVGAGAAPAWALAFVPGARTPNPAAVTALLAAAKALAVELHHTPL